MRAGAVQNLAIETNCRRRQRDELHGGGNPQQKAARFRGQEKVEGRVGHVRSMSDPERWELRALVWSWELRGGTCTARNRQVGTFCHSACVKVLPA